MLSNTTGNGRNAMIPAAGNIQIEEESSSQMAHEVADLLMAVEFCSRVNTAIALTDPQNKERQA